MHLRHLSEAQKDIFFDKSAVEIGYDNGSAVVECGKFCNCHPVFQGCRPRLCAYCEEKGTALAVYGLLQKSDVASVLIRAREMSDQISDGIYSETRKKLRAL